MDRIVSNCIRYVMIYTPHELQFLISASLNLFLTINYITSPQPSGKQCIYILSGVYTFSSSSGVHIYLQAWHDWKNNHPCTTPGRLVLYDLYLEYFKCLYQFHAWDWKICMKVNIYQEASKNTNAHWAKKTMGVNQ